MNFLQFPVNFCNKTSSFEQFKFITEDYFTEHTNTTTKLKWKLFTKVMKERSKEAWGLDRQHLITREVQVL